MKIVIFVSCSKSKKLSHPNQPKCRDLIAKNLRERFIDIYQEKKPAKDLYIGVNNLSTNSAVKILREFFEVKYYIVSAGFGILDENDLVPPYDCSFSDMNKEEIINRAKLLQIPEDYKRIISTEKPDLIYLGLGKNYLQALGDWDIDLPCKVIAFETSKNKNVISLPADNIVVKETAAISALPIHGVVGFKGDLLLLSSNYLKNQKNPEQALKELLDKPEDFLYLMNTLRII